MDKDKGAKANSSKGLKETTKKSTTGSKESRECRETREARETQKRERDGRASNATKDLRETRSGHRRERDSKNEREGKRYRERENRDRERDSKSERESRRDRESEGERENKAGEIELENRKLRESKREHDVKDERKTRSESISTSNVESSKNVKEIQSMRLLKDMRREKDAKEAKQVKEMEKHDAKTLMHDIKDLIMRALECELGGHILEARMLYEESLAKLHIYSDKEQNEEILESYRKYLASYEKHVQRLRDQIDQDMFSCKIIEHIAIPEGTRGRSYEKLFGCYFNEKVTLAHIYEPCLTQSSHLEHLINFIEVLVKNCPSLMFVRVITHASSNASKLQSEVLHDLGEELESGNISFNYQFDEQLKKPRIILNTGVVIRCKRGLHIYKPVTKYYKLGLYDYDFRRCEAAEFDIYQGKPFSEAISKADKTDLMESLLHS